MEKIKYIKPKETDGNYVMNFKQIGKGVALSIAICIALLLLSAVLFTYTSMSLSFVSLISNTVFYAGALFSGLISGYGLRANGWLHGIISGGIFVFVILLISFFAEITDAKFVFPFLKIILSVVLGGIGGIVGVNIYPQKNNRR